MASEHILIVDDEPHIVSLCSYVLQDQGHTVQGVTNAAEAITIIESEPPDLLIIDIKMPEIDGLTILRRAREVDPNLTAVVITGYATMDRAIEALNSGARGFVLKPFGVEELTLAVGKALAQRKQEEERLLLRAQLPILEIGQMLMTEGNVGELSRRLLETVKRQVGADQAALMLLDEKAENLYVAAALGLSEQQIRQVHMPVQSDVIESALQAQQPLMWNLQPQADMEPSLRALTGGQELDTMVLVPLRTGKRDVGLLSLCYLPRTLPIPGLRSSDLNLLAIIGHEIATALENGRLYAVEQQRTAGLEQALKQQQELDLLKNQFIRNVSHELRTPLAMILGYADLLASGELGKMDPEQQEPLKIIVQRSLVLRDLVENITAILDNEIREPVQEPVFLTQVVSSAVNDFQILAGQANLALSSDISDQVPAVLGDPEHLRRIVDNLIDNALKFTPSGGAVTVSLCNAGADAILEVSDTGIGIPDEHQGRIFDRFYQVDGTTRRRHGGCGLGLALVKEIVASYRGTVSLKSQVGQGSTFTVCLPLRDGPSGG